MRAASKPPLLPKTLIATMNFKETFLDFLTKFKRTNNLGINSKSRQAQNENFCNELTTAPEEQRTTKVRLFYSALEINGGWEHGGTYYCEGLRPAVLPVRQCRGK